MMKLYAKAIVAFITTTCGATAIALADGQITTVEALGIVATVTAATAAVFGITNTPPPPSASEIVGRFTDGSRL